MDAEPPVAVREPLERDSVIKVMRFHRIDGHDQCRTEVQPALLALLGDGVAEFPCLADRRPAEAVGQIVLADH